MPFCEVNTQAQEAIQESHLPSSFHILAFPRQRVAFQPKACLGQSSKGHDFPRVPKLRCGRRERGAGHCSGAAMIDAQPIGQKWRSNGNEMPIAHIGVDIMVLSVLFPNRELDK